MARRMIRPRGTIMMKSTYHGQPPIDLSMVVVDEVTLKGSRCGPFGPALRLMQNGLVNLKPLIHGRFPLSDAISGFEKAIEKGVLKVLLEIPQS